MYKGNNVKIREYDMNLYQNFKIFIYFFLCFLLFFNNAFAFDLIKLQQQCVDIGFHIKTPENGKCVLSLINKIRESPNAVTPSNKISAPGASENEVAAAEKRSYERRQSYQKDAEIDLKKREIEALQQQVQQQNQQELLRQQKQNSSLTRLLQNYCVLTGYVGINAC